MKLFDKIKRIWDTPEKMNVLEAHIIETSARLKAHIAHSVPLPPDPPAPPDPPYPDWSKVPIEDLPERWGPRNAREAYRVAYVVVTQDPHRALEIPDPRGTKTFAQRPLFVWSQHSEYGEGTLQKRTIAKMGKVLQIFVEGNDYHVGEVPGHDKDVTRAWSGDGGSMYYRLTPWQTVDGRTLGTHIDPELFINLTACMLWPQV